MKDYNCENSLRFSVVDKGIELYTGEDYSNIYDEDIPGLVEWLQAYLKEKESKLEVKARYFIVFYTFLTKQNKRGFKSFPIVSEKYLNEIKIVNMISNTWKSGAIKAWDDGILWGISITNIVELSKEDFEEYFS